MINIIAKLSNIFYKAANEIADKALEEVSEDLVAPQRSDEDDVKILMRRAVKFLNTKDIPNAIKTLLQIDKFIRQFQHEAFDEEFLEFAADQDLWDWVTAHSSGEVSDNDKMLLPIIRDNLLYLNSRPNLFKW